MICGYLYTQSQRSFCAFCTYAYHTHVPTGTSRSCVICLCTTCTRSSSMPMGQLRSISASACECQSEPAENDQTCWCRLFGEAGFTGIGVPTCMRGFCSGVLRSAYSAHGAPVSAAHLATVSGSEPNPSRLPC